MAGLTVAYALANGERTIHLWEKEKLPCMFSSSKNAAIFRTYESDPTLSMLVKESYKQLGELEKKAGTLLDRCGLLINPLEQDYYENAYIKNNPEMTELRSVGQTIHLPEGLDFSGYFLSANGIVDIHSLQNYYIRTASMQGAVFHYNHEINMNIEDGAVQLSNGNSGNIKMSANSLIINAAGSWAVNLLKASHVWTPPVEPYKRHLFFIRSRDKKTGHVKKNNVQWPVLWNEKRDFYLRSEGDGFLGTHCDQRETHAGDYVSDEKEFHRFLPSAISVFPFLKDYHIARYWACLRTFSLDQIPVIGFDPFIKNLFWVSGLGGRGITISPGLIPEIQRLVSSNSSETNVSLKNNPYSPIRFIHL